MRTYKTKAAIKAALRKLAQSSIPGFSNDGAPVMVRIKFTMNAPTEKAKRESALARRAGLDLKLYTGLLDRVFRTVTGKVCFTMLAKERVDLHRPEYCYRTFNVDSGQVESITA